MYLELASLHKNVSTLYAIVSVLLFYAPRSTYRVAVPPRHFCGQCVPMYLCRLVVSWPWDRLPLKIGRELRTGGREEGEEGKGK